MVCYLKIERDLLVVSLLRYSKLTSELISELTQSFELPLGTRAIIELTRLKCKWKGTEKGKGTDEKPLGQTASLVCYVPWTTG